MQPHTIIVRQLGLRAYTSVWHAMRNFTDKRDANTLDELWLVEHPPVFTQGQAGKAAHLLNPGDIPVIHSDRGGQVTYHGPGQVVMYVLLDLKRANLGIRQLVTTLEQSVIATLARFDISAEGNPHAPGVYVGKEKICSLGLRVRHGCTFHGLALNIAMDLRPFECINPCGYPGLVMTQVAHWHPDATVNRVSPILVAMFTHLLGYDAMTTTHWDPQHYV